MMMMNFVARLAHTSRELRLFVVASLAMGTASSMIDATLNNFLNERFSLSGFERSFLEFLVNCRGSSGFSCVPCSGFYAAGVGE